MNAIGVSYDRETDIITMSATARPRDWQEVCEAYSGDVHRVRDAEDHLGYTGLYVCYDDDNKPDHFLVAEDDALHRLKRRNFLKKLGK